MSDPMLTALWDAIERRSTEDTTALDQARRIREARAHADHYPLGDPARFIPGQIDNQRKRKKKP